MSFMEMSNVFWAHQPSNLISSATVIPNREMCDEELLNTITRLVIVIALVLVLFRVNRWWLFLILGLLLVVILWYTMGKRDDPPDRVEHFRCPRTQNVATNPKIAAAQGERIARLKARYRS